MPLKIIRNDITKITCDVIVNSANPEDTFGGGCDYAIYEAAGMEDMFAARKKIGRISVGKAAVTEGFQLSCKYVIHTAGPIYQDGKSGEDALLRSCYEECLSLALSLSANSIAFPLISAGTYAYPREEAFKIALSACESFLLSYDMDIYLVLFDRLSFTLGKRIREEIESFLGDKEVDLLSKKEYAIDREPAFYESRKPERAKRPQKRVFAGKNRTKREEMVLEERIFKEMNLAPGAEMHSLRSLKELDSLLTENFQEMLFRLIKEKGFMENDVRRNANMSKQTFSKIRKNPYYQPKKDTAFALAIGLHLNLDETTDFLSKAGYAFNPSDLRDWVVRFFIEQEIYDLAYIDAVLEDEFELSPLTFVPTALM